MHPRAHTRQFAPVQVVPVQELKGRRAAWHHTRPERPRITNPGGPNMHSPPTAHSPPQTRHSALAADVPAVAARPIYTYGTHAPRHGIKGVCYRNGGMLSCGVFLVYLVVHSLEYSIFLRGKRYLGIFSECILFGP